VRSQNFVHCCVTASLARYVNFCVLLAVLTSEFHFHFLSLIYKYSHRF